MFCILIVLFFAKYVRWPLTYFFPHRLRKGHRDYCVQCLRSEVTPVDSKVYYHPVFALSQCAQIIDRYKFFSSQPMHLKVISTTIFDRIAKQQNSKTAKQQNSRTANPHPKSRSIKEEAAQKPKKAIFSILGGWGRGVAATYTQSYVTSYINETASQQ